MDQGEWTFEIIDLMYLADNRKTASDFSKSIRNNKGTEKEENKRDELNKRWFVCLIIYLCG